MAILHPLGPGQQIPIDRAVVLVGRSPECDAVIDSSAKVSRLHCALIQVDSEYYIRDLGSMNGILVGGVRVEKDARLTHGTEVQIGDTRFRFFENVMPVPGKSPVNGASRPTPVLIDETTSVRPERPQSVPAGQSAEAAASGNRIASGKPSSPRSDGLPSVKGSSSPGLPHKGGRDVVTGQSDQQRRKNNRDEDIVDVSEVIEIHHDEDVVEDLEIIDVVEIVDDDAEIIEIEDVEIVDDFDMPDDPPLRPPR